MQSSFTILIAISLFIAFLIRDNLNIINVESRRRIQRINSQVIDTRQIRSATRCTSARQIQPNVVPTRLCHVLHQHPVIFVYVATSRGSDFNLPFRTYFGNIAAIDIEMQVPLPIFADINTGEFAFQRSRIPTPAANTFLYIVRIVIVGNIETRI